MEIWGKWTVETLPLPADATVCVEKTRWLRKFDLAGPVPRQLPLGPDEKPLEGRLPEFGCNAELTHVVVGDHEAWVTLGFEAFGPLNKVEDGMRATAAALARRDPPPLSLGLLASYPAWLGLQVVADR